MKHEDKALATDYDFAVLSKMTPCQSIDFDLEMKLLGLVRKHCAGRNDDFSTG